MCAVLLVEDELSLCGLIAEAFEHRRVPVSSVTTDRAAYAILEDRPGRFALLIADINLGEGTTGFDVARRARQLDPKIKVIYITGDASTLDRFGVEGGRLFPKPFAPADLVDTAVSMLAC